MKGLSGGIIHRGYYLQLYAVVETLTKQAAVSQQLWPRKPWSILTTSLIHLFLNG